MDKIATLLLKFAGPSGTAAPSGAGLTHLAAGTGLAVKSIQVNHAVAGGESYVYFELKEPLALGAADMGAIEQAAREVRELAPLRMTAARLSRVLERPGASAGVAAPFHYCVEFDPEPGWEAEIASWYDVEHLPGLAAVGGCVRAQRLLNLDGGPRSFACYDLVSLAARESKAWQDVVATPWASRVRPHFRNAKRTVFHRLPGQ